MNADRQRLRDSALPPPRTCRRRSVADEVFEGNTADPGVVAAQAGKLAGRFPLSRVVLAGDWGMLTDAASARAKGRINLGHATC